MMHRGADQTLRRDLTPRQSQVLELLAKGLTNADIGHALQISEGTVRTHVSALLKALNVLNRTEAATLFRSDGPSSASFFDQPAIAVLPMDLNAVTDPLARSFGLGVSDYLIRLLSRHAMYPVIARSSTLDVPNRGSVREIARSLQARFVVSGRVLEFGPQIHLAIHVDDAETGSMIWSEDHSVPRGELFKLHHEIVETLVAHLYPHLVSQVTRSTNALAASELQPWQLAQLGFARYAERSPEANQEARALFERAIAQRPSLFLAEYGRGLTSYQDVMNDWADRDAARQDLARSTRNCSELAHDAAETQFLLARSYQAVGDIEAALPYLERATQVNPSFAEAYSARGQMAIITGANPADGLELMQRASQLSPRVHLGGLALAHFAAHQIGEALDEANRVLQQRPSYTFARVLACVSAHALGDREVAEQHFRLLQGHTKARPEEVLRSLFGDHRFEAVERIIGGLEALSHGS